MTLTPNLSYEDRQDLLGHRSRRITTHYSGAESATLIEAANKVCGENFRKIPTLVLLKQNAAAGAAMARGFFERIWRAQRDSNSRPPGSKFAFENLKFCF